MAEILSAALNNPVVRLISNPGTIIAPGENTVRFHPRQSNRRIRRILPESHQMQCDDQQSTTDSRKLDRTHRKVLT